MSLITRLINIAVGVLPALLTTVLAIFGYPSPTPFFAGASLTAAFFVAYSQFLGDRVPDGEFVTFVLLNLNLLIGMGTLNGNISIGQVFLVIVFYAATHCGLKGWARSRGLRERDMGFLRWPQWVIELLCDIREKRTTLPVHQRRTSDRGTGRLEFPTFYPFRRRRLPFAAIMDASDSADSGSAGDSGDIEAGQNV